MKCIALLLLVISSWSLNGQTDSIVSYIMSLKEHINNEKKSILLSKEEKASLPLILQNKDVSSAANAEVAYACGSVVRYIDDQKIRKIMLKQIIGRCADDKAIKCNAAISSLRFLEVKEFEKEDKELLFQRMLSNGATDNTVLLVGYLNFSKANKYLENLYKSNKEINWYVRLALARIGDKNSIDYCIKKVNLDKPNFILLRELVYIKQPQLIDLYYNYLVSDKSALGSYDVPPVSYSTIGVKYLSKLLFDFPLEDQVRPYTPAQIALARQWMLANKGKYKIRRDEF